MAARAPNPNAKKDKVQAKAKNAKVASGKREKTQARIKERVVQNRNRITGRVKSPASGTSSDSQVVSRKRHNSIKPEVLFSPEILKQVSQMAAIGLPNEDIAAALDISEERFYKDKRVIPELNEAIVKGRAQGHAAIAGVMFNAAQGGNLQAATFVLERRHGKVWRPAPQEIHNTNLNATTTAESIARIKALVPRRGDAGGAA